ncbi:MAG: glycosyltransferase [Candidatus Omnitrophica bacterium]|nr:glycosyltransferase [Candidatus Omnitrophota bacterium]
MGDIFLSILIPAYNEEKNLRATLSEISGYLSARDLSCEVLIVDDGSSDSTFEIASSCKELFREMRVLKNAENKGKGFSIKKGISEARGENILFMDADSSTSIEQLDRFLPLSGEHDIHIASRRVPGANVSMPLNRAVLGKIYIILASLILRIRVKDLNCGFKIFKTPVARDVFARQVMSGWSFDAEVLFIAGKRGYSIKEVPVEWTYGEHSKVRPLKDGIESFIGLLRIKMNDLSGKYS